MNEYDIIVIGAGNGGLAAAATAASDGKSVILFEKHNIPGGCGTSFRRGRFEFEVALHQLSHLGTEANPGPLRELFSRYGIMDDLEFIQIKDLYQINYPDGTSVTLPSDKKECVKYLSKVFPQEKDNIERYYDMVYQFCKESNEFAMKAGASKKEPNQLKKAIMKIGFPRIYPTLQKYALKTTQEVLDEFFKDKKLQMALSAYWCFMGMPPTRFPFAILAKCQNFYLETKPYYVKGTSMAMNQAICESIRKNGGTIRLNCGIKKILLKDGKACGVITENNEKYYAKKLYLIYRH